MCIRDSDYYAELGVSRDASAEEIKRGYRKAARKLHPDVNPGPEAEEQFKKVSQAYDVLSDVDKRRQYDMGADPYADAAAGFGPGFSFSASDLFDAFFGGAGAARGTVSYTHLRAHETVLDLVCRLLLAKKKHNWYALATRCTT